ncbi:MAG TPA: type II secretion system protein [Candidatus Dojkabacteria bacterium]|nr:type II secretion system protein [Candidatus Dojkabacteria bacterium]
MRKLKAFTLVEIIIVVGLFSAIVLIGVPLSQTTLAGSEVDTAFEVTAKTLRSSQAYAQAGVEDSTWGVHLSGNTVTQFKGSDYAARDSEFDAVTIFSSKINFSGVSEVIFSKLTGLPSSTGAITISEGDRSVTININSTGALSF